MSRRTTAQLLGLSVARARLLFGGLAVVAALVLASPGVMLLLPAWAVPWPRLADIGDAYGGASALLSALALCGVGASLIFQRRQVRQELVDLERQQHLELLRLAIDNPEFVSVLEADARNRPNVRIEIYANLVVSYWLAIWELGEIDDQELRGMTSAMFGNEILREWWSRVHLHWIGTRQRPDRVRFLELVTEECRVAAAASAAPPRGGERRASGSRWGLLAAVGAGLVGGAMLARRRRRAADGDPNSTAQRVAGVRAGWKDR